MANRIGVYPNVPLAECLEIDIEGNYYVTDVFGHKRRVHESELEYPPSFNKGNSTIEGLKKIKLVNKE